MELKQFKGERISELSMVRVAKAVLEKKGKVMDFHDIFELVSDYIGMSKEERKNHKAQFYTDINVDGEFISLGDNAWGLRNWYPVDSINEVLTHENDEEDVIPHISPDGFDEYQDPALAKEFKEEIDDERLTSTPSIDEDSDALEEYKDNLEEIGADDIDEEELADLDEELLDEEDEDL
ncbi:MAG: DNA-directed RNA polymerase subunit delta [Atopostipes sp.]|nr:DNA-directed RNA polymerase subunit delta [Atopostipes sp.]